MPRRFRQPALLIVGCGDIGLRSAALLRGRYRLLALTSNASRTPLLRSAGIVPLLGDLDQPASLRRLAGLAALVLHLAPPPSAGNSDPRTAALLHALSRRGGIHRIVYGSTTGVYGDCGGERFDETRAPNPTTDRARRRVDAERWLRAYGRTCGRNSGRTSGACVSILRIPGIYAASRDGGPRDRLLRGMPVLDAADDVYTNHIHADDLARACMAALHRGRPQRVVHVCDGNDLLMGDYFDRAADLFGLPRPRRVSRAQAATQLSPMALSFMSESRRLVNERLRRELRLMLRHPTVETGLLV